MEPFHSGSPFLRLPAEIRDRIYKYVLGGEVFEYGTSKPRTDQLSLRQTNDTLITIAVAVLLMFVSCQIYQETRLLPFKMSGFYVDMSHLRIFCECSAWASGTPSGPYVSVHHVCWFACDALITGRHHCLIEDRNNTSGNRFAARAKSGVSSTIVLRTTMLDMLARLFNLRTRSWHLSMEVLGIRSRLCSELMI